MSAKKGRSLAVNKRKILESAQKHLQRGALDKALEDYQTLLKADPKDSNIRLKVGDLHLKLGRTQDAIDAYLRVAQQFTNDGFDAKAVALYKQITKLDEKRFEVHAQLGELYQRMGLGSEAMKAIQHAADGAHRAGDKGQALNLLRRMAALDPTNTASRLKVADLLRAEGKTEDALAEYDEVVHELERQQNTEEQIKVIERALELAPARIESLRALARAAIEAGVFEKAERAAAALVDLKPDDLDGLELHGTALDRAGRAEEAAQVFRGLAEKFRARGDEDRARALSQRWGAGEVFDIGGSDSAVLDGDSADLEIDPELDASLGLSEGSEIELGSEVAPAAPEVIADDTFEPTSDLVDETGVEGGGDSAGDPEQLLAEASVFSRYGKHERAIDTLRAALRIDPGNAVALEKLGEALVVIGNRPHAASALSRAGAAFATAGDAAGVERVRTRLAPLDAKAAAALPALAREPEPESDEIDIEIDGDLEDETMTPVAGEAAREPEAAPDDFSGIDIDVSGELAESEAAEPSEAEHSDAPLTPRDDAEITFEVSEPAAEPEPEPAAKESAPDEKATTPADAALSDFEEAEFYREQGLVSEARGLYERVLSSVPNHSQARQRLAELGPAKPSAAPKPSRDPAPEPVAASPALTLELDENDSSAGASPLQAEPGPAPPVPAVPVRAAPAPNLEPDAAPPSSPVVAEPAITLASEAADFDLAAELSGAFDDAGSARTRANPGAEGFEEVFAAFKAGVKREVDDGDTEAHYDLGIAYKEMGLLEDAIGEFRIALGDVARRIPSLHMMGVCALEIGRGADAVAHLSEALAGGSLPSEQEAALRIDLGRAHLACGDRARARREYEAARAADAGFAAIDRLIAELDALPAEAAPQPNEALESFDDLIEDNVRETAAASVPAPPQYESFDELLSDDGGTESDAAVSTDAGVLEAEPIPEIELREEVSADAELATPVRSEKIAEPAPPEPAPSAEPTRAPSAPAARRKKKISFV